MKVLDQLSTEAAKRRGPALGETMRIPAVSEHVADHDALVGHVANRGDERAWGIDVARVKYDPADELWDRSFVLVGDHRDRLAVVTEERFVFGARCVRSSVSPGGIGIDGDRVRVARTAPAGVVRPVDGDRSRGHLLVLRDAGFDQSVAKGNEAALAPFGVDAVAYLAKTATALWFIQGTERRNWCRVHRCDHGRKGAFDLAIGEGMDASTHVVGDVEALLVTLRQANERLVDAGEMARSVIGEGQEDPEQQGPHRELARTATFRHGGLDDTDVGGIDDGLELADGGHLS
jgi:hypothetical protein